MKKYYIVSETKDINSKTAYEDPYYAVLKGAQSIMESEYGIKSKVVVLQNAKKNKSIYTIIERYENHAESLRKKAYMICIDSNDIEKANILAIKEIDNLYNYLKINNVYNIVYNHDNMSKMHLDVPNYDIDILFKSFLDMFDMSKKDRKRKIKKLKELFPNSISIIEKLEIYISNTPRDEAISTIKFGLENENFDFLSSRKNNTFIRKMIKKI